MATLNWPTTPEFRPMAIRWGLTTPKSAWRSFYTGQRQSVSHLADRLRCTIWLPAAFGDAAGGYREAFLRGLSSTGDWVYLRHFRRVQPTGTARGTITLLNAGAAGAKTIDITGITPVSTGTLLPGDMLGIGGHLVMVNGTFAANGSGQISGLTLATPLLVAASAGAAVTWASPTGQFELVGPDPDVEYSAGDMQAPLQLDFSQVIP